MKTFNQLKIIATLILSIAFSVGYAQNTYKGMVDAKNFVFKAQTANPMTGSPVQLSSGYDLTVSKDRITAYLPYFGRATTAPIDPADGGIKFSSQSYVYNVTDRKGGGWDVLIDFKDVPTVRSMTLTFFDNGTATLDVTSNQRDLITFRGKIEGYKPTKSSAKK